MKGVVSTVLFGTANTLSTAMLKISTKIANAKILHAAGTHFKKGRWSGMEMPPTMTQLAKKSKAEEEREKRRENNMNRRMKND